MDIEKYKKDYYQTVVERGKKKPRNPARQHRRRPRPGGSRKWIGLILATNEKIGSICVPNERPPKPGRSWPAARGRRQGRSREISQSWFASAIIKIEKRYILID